MPDFPAPSLLKEAASAAILGDDNQYAITSGALSLKEALARKYERFYGMTVDPEREVTITCGATEAMASVMLGLVDPGDEVILMEPFYECYGPDVALAGATPVYVTLEPPEYRLDRAALEAAVTPATVACAPSAAACMAAPAPCSISCVACARRSSQA